MNEFSLTSTFNDTTYDIKVYIPKEQVPTDGFPIYYVLDGLSYFSFVQDGIRLQQLNTAKTSVSSAIVVGICHKEEEMRLKRFIDFTAPAKSLIVPNHAKGKLPDSYGGAEKFYQFIDQELMPVIEAQYPVNREHQTVFGHSLGGYFALWCLFTHPTKFSNYIAISPSIWWNGQELLNMGKHFIANGANERKNRIFIAVGEREGFMVNDATTISSLLADCGLITESYVAPDENHASVVPTVLSRALRFCSK
ncbi:MAG: alpha/beta hydrolase [Lysinibacillus sp.]